MDPLIIILAFGCGYIASRIHLPPLVGYLVAGFVLSTMGYTSTPTIQAAADIGVTILLFSIGLKLRIKGLLRPEVWAGASGHMFLVVVIFGSALFALSALGIGMFATLDLQTALLIAFALSFSSTVFAVKILEGSDRTRSLNGRMAIGILIMQDIFAVLFLAFSTGKLPTPWAVTVLVALPIARWFFMRILDRIGHGELQVLFGFFLAFVAGAWAFEVVGLKADLGALIMGILLAPHPRAEDLARSLLNIKDALLVGFFLNIGLIGLPTLSMLGTSTLLLLVLPIKVILFFLILTRFHLRARTSLITAFNLANYSEFGLIVCGLAVNHGWLPDEWLLTLAVALSLSFVIASPFNSKADAFFDKWESHLTPFETIEYHPDEEPYEEGTWQIAVVGMGRIGTSTYDYFTNKFGPVVLGLDFSPYRVDLHLEAGRQVALADVTDPDFWRRLPEVGSRLKLMILTIPNLKAQLETVRRIREWGFAGHISAMVQYQDEMEVMKEAGVTTSFNVFMEAGVGLATHISEELDLSIVEPNLPTDETTAVSDGQGI